MQERDLFEYGIIRFVPRVERDEFFHIGVVLFCKKQNFLEAKFHINETKLQAMAPNFDFQELEQYTLAFSRICQGKDSNSPISLYEKIERFRWLTANRSTVLQVSPVHPGLCMNASETLQKIFEEQVL